MAAHASRTVVDAVDSPEEAPGSVFDSPKPGAAELQWSPSGALPATGRILGRMIYNTSYAVSFGVTFPVMMIVRVVPTDNAMVHGLVDGALAARHRVEDWRGGRAIEAAHHEDEEAEADASENGEAHPAHRRRTTKRAATRKTTKAPSRKKS